MIFDLVFEGGGAKGMIFVGALREFFQRGHTPGRLMGTSAGAITATLLAAGYSTEEMLAALSEQVNGKSVFASFITPPAALNSEMLEHGVLSTLLKEHNIPLIPEILENLADKALLRALNNNRLGRSLLSLLEYGGLYSADGFVTWLTQKLNSGETNGVQRTWGGLTLAEFTKESGKNLTVIASDTSGREMLVLNAQTAPNLPLVWAVRMSMSVPLVWQEVVWQHGWGTYRGADLSGHIIVDGGLLSNFPLELFVSDLPWVTAIMGAGTHGDVLGLLLDDDAPVPGITPTPDPTQALPIRRFSNLIYTMLEGRDKAVITAFDRFVARLPAGGIGLLDFEMDAPRLNALLEAGQKAMRQFLQRYAPARGPASFGLEETPATPQATANLLAARLLTRAGKPTP